MIERYKGKVTLTCDECSEWLDQNYDEANFTLMIGEAIRGGWTIRRHDDEWSHLCPDCKPSSLEEQRRRLGL